MNEEDWAESWKAFFWPCRITERITVKPTWRDYRATPEEIVLEIDPGMAFGTGTHPSTALCLLLMERFLSPGAAFLDIGTGSGILMVAAAKLGAGRMTGVDNDEMALQIAEKNLLLNAVDHHQYELTSGDLATGLVGRFDMIAVNILSAAILSLLDTIQRIMSKSSVLICSGIYEDNCTAVLKKMQAKGLTVLDVRHQDRWSAIACCRSKPAL